MTFEEYLTDNCGLRIMEGLEEMGPGMERCTLPGRIMDEESFPETGTCCTPVSMVEVERVYYKPGDEIPSYWADRTDKTGDSGEAQKGLHRCRIQGCGLDMSDCGQGCQYGQKSSPERL